MAIYIYFVTSPYAAPGVIMAMLFFYSGLVTFPKKHNLQMAATVGDRHRWAAILRLFFSDLQKKFLFFQRNFSDKALVPFIGVCLLFLLNFGCVATGIERDDSAKMPVQTFTVKGKIQKVSGEEGIMVVASPKGDRIILKFTSQTPVVGGAMKDVDKFQSVKAVYAVEAGQNRLLLLELLPQGSCSGQ